MKKLFLLFISVYGIGFSVQAQQPNGTLDDIKEFATKITVPFIMPDGIKLYTDVYVPRVRDSLRLSLGTLDLGIATIATDTLTFIPYGTQLLIYDSLNGQPNPNPYQLPTVFTRTPYDKGGFDELGSIFPILGYNYVLQDMRGRYSSEGVYFPMYSDSWNKNPYHPGIGHVLDYLLPSDPRFSNKHEDGYNSIKSIEGLDSAYAASVGVSELADFYKGLPHTNTNINNGSIGMFGASALANTQLQLACAHRVTDSIPALKCLMPIVGTTEHMISTGYNNGVFRDRIVTGWLKGQIFDTEDDLIPVDNDRQNSIHTSKDYDLPKTITLNGLTKDFQQNKFEASNLAIDHFTAMRYFKQDGTLGNAGFYPNSVGRPDMDASTAPVNQNGEAVDPVTQNPLPDLNYSRYTNLDIPVLHITGWWDIFTEGQINTRNYTYDAIGGTAKNLQKIIIGPWAHQTISGRISGDRTYPKNVTELTKIDLSDFNIDDVPLATIVQSDLVTWFRYNLNYEPGHVIGEPKFMIPESQKWQKLNSGSTVFGDIYVRVPANAGGYKVTFAKMINFLAGYNGLDGLEIEVKNAVLGQFKTTQAVPNIGQVLPSLGGAALDSIPFRDFLNDVPNYRIYVAGGDSATDALTGFPDNYKMGNYWMGMDKFPPDQHIEWKKMFLHQDGSFNENAPTQDEGFKMYVNDPDDPILTVGGSNMIVRSPDGTRNSQSQMELTDPASAPYTMDREGVIQFNSDPIQDSMTIIGLPVCTLYAKSNPSGLTSGPTDCDWMVRLCDVWPDGRVYFVQDIVVNARARDWARALVDDMGTPGTDTYVNGVEDPGDKDIPYSNIEIGQIYQYVFKGLPVAYNWAKGHRIRVLISSSSYTHYQANPNVPLNDGEFFRRKPGDGQSYYFEGEQIYPRVTVQRVHFSPENPTSINFPVYNTDFTYNAVKPEVITPKFDATVFPNPATDKIQVFVNMPGDHEVVITDITGRTVTSAKFDDNVIFHTESYGQGLYFATITDLNKPAEKVTKRFVIE